jgi:folate-dependent phosphoribosylglycinamide formyltransferase PurN
MKIVILGGESCFTQALYHAVNKTHPVHKVILDGHVSRKAMLCRRIKKIGLWKTMSQMLFKFFVEPFLAIEAKPRIKEISDMYKLDYSPIPNDKVIETESVNSQFCIDQLRNMKPDLILVIGTRIISQKVLDAVDCPFVNMHTGITPLYRGVHGAYWALVENDLEHCGVTIHFVDKGIDTGDVIAQAVVAPTLGDNFLTYPYLQLAAGIRLELEMISSLSSGNITTVKPQLPSVLRTHPTLWQYMHNRIWKKVK